MSPPVPRPPLSFTMTVFASNSGFSSAVRDAYAGRVATASMSASLTVVAALARSLSKLNMKTCFSKIVQLFAVIFIQNLFLRAVFSSSVKVICIPFAG
jgi:hypothetical protein